MGRTCSCGKAIREENKSGMCFTCCRAARRVIRTCSDCACTITKKSTTGRCITCANKMRRTSGMRERRRPLHKTHCDCGTLLSRGSRTGICRTCFNNRIGFALPSEPRVWCTQCERNVLTAEGSQCRSQWCGAKAAA